MGFIAINKAFERPPKTTSPRKLLATVTAGFVFLTIPIVMFFIDPILIIAKKNTHVSNGSLVHKLLAQESVSVHVQTYLFNVTNVERFQKGLDKKLKVEEIGPFTYSELRRHEDLEIDEAGGVIKYTPKLRTVFLPNESIADPRNVTVTMPNVAMLSMVGMAANYPFFSKMAFNMLATNMNSKAFVTLPAHNFLWGYEDPLIALGNTVMPGWIFFDTLGILDRMYDRKNHHRLVVGGRDEDKFEVKSMDGFDGLTQWGYEEPEQRSKCNTFKNGYEGIAYPTELTPNTEVRIFRNILCRFLELDFQEKTTKFGGDALSYKISNRTFTINEDTKCLCGKGMCIEGISDISPCFYGLPLAISNAHFMDFPKLQEKIEGLKPDANRHGSKFLIEPKIGMVLDTEFSLQLNVVLGDSTYNNEAKNLANMVVPVMYFKIMAAVPQETIDNVKMIYVTGPKIFLALEIVSIAIGLILLVYSATLIYWNWLWSEGKGISFHLPSDTKEAHIISVEIPLMDMVDAKD